MAGSTDGEDQVIYLKKLNWLESIRKEHSLPKDTILLKYGFRVFWAPEDENWVAISPAFRPGLSAMGDTPTEALQVLRNVIIPMALETMKEDGEEPPTPLTWPERLTDEGDHKTKA